MWFKGREIDGNFTYVRKNSQNSVLTVFANVVEIREDKVVIERFTNYGRHQLPMVVKSTSEFDKDYRLITTKDKYKIVRSCDYER